MKEVAGYISPYKKPAKIKRGKKGKKGTIVKR